MKYIDEFRDGALIGRLTGRINALASGAREYTFMDVCGTHTMAISRFGLRGLLPNNVKLISGPGCPVCVTPTEYIDRAIAIARLPRLIITTFGDMLRLPGSRSTLEKEKSRGRIVKAVYSTDDALDIARRNPGKEVVFLGVGFETTSPTVAASIIAAAKRGIRNYSVLSAHKSMPEVLETIMADSRTIVDGLLLPGHVTAITGMRAYASLAKSYGKGCVAAGFEPVDILQAILMLMSQKKPIVEVQYRRIVEPCGNPIARKAIETVFDKCLSSWRGIGKVSNSGLKIKKKFSAFDALLKFKVNIPQLRENKACICGEILKGIKMPSECVLFARKCVPAHPVGPCMVSSEGTCAAYYKYGRK